MFPCKEDLENGICVNRTLQEIKDYLLPADLLIYLNTERFDSREYHDKKIVRESKVLN